MHPERRECVPELPTERAPESSISMLPLVTLNISRRPTSAESAVQVPPRDFAHLSGCAAAEARSKLQFHRAAAAGSPLETPVPGRDGTGRTDRSCRLLVPLPV